MFRCEGLLYEVRTCKAPGEPRQLRLVQVDERAPRREAPVPGISLSIAEVQALFTGPLLLRAQRVASLTTVQCLTIFGAPRGDGSHYSYAIKLQKIGAAIRAPAAAGTLDGGCGTCAELVSACEGCARRIVHEALLDEPFVHLEAAARHKKPLDQFDAAEHARIRCRRKRAERRRAPGAQDSP